MTNPNLSLILAATLVALVVVTVAFFFCPPLSFFTPLIFTNNGAATTTTTVVSTTQAVVVPPPVVHQPMPTPTRALYMAQCVAATPKLREGLIKIADQTEINAFVVDLKDFSGTVAFPSATAVTGGRGCVVRDFVALIKQLHEHQIYIIGRVTVFQDPLYTKIHPEQAVQRVDGGVWHDHKGLAFVDVSATPFHDYIINLSKEAYALGVDELNFDYIRYPSDGDMKAALYIQTGASHAANLEKFFATLTSAVHAMPTYPVLSADLFGMVSTNYDDLGIGQVLERALPYFDFIDPMVYPSHYPSGFNGYQNVNDHPYDIIHFSLSHAVARAMATSTLIASPIYERMGTSTPAVYRKPAYPKAKIRPWLQDFNYPVTYTPAMVKAQIQATYDVGLDSWLMWSPSNQYTTSVLAPALRP